MYLKRTVRDNYIEWRIQRPERRNGLGISIGQELYNALLQLENSLQKQQKTRALVVSATPTPTKLGKVWIAGGDLKELSLLSKKIDGHNYARLYHDICQKMEFLPIPVIFAIDGQAIGGGIELALAGDIRIATHSSSFHFKQTRIGLASGYGGATRLSSLVGQSRAMFWLLQSSTVDSHTAESTGLIHKTCANDQLESTLEQVVENICQSPYQSIQVQKQMLRPQASGALSRELDLFTELWMNPDHEKFLRTFNQ